MTREEIIRLAREAEVMSQYDEASPWVEDHPITEYVERFAALVAAAVRAEEREAILNHATKAHTVDGNCDIVLAADIRARGEK